MRKSQLSVVEVFSAVIAVLILSAFLSTANSSELELKAREILMNNQKVQRLLISLLGSEDMLERVTVFYCGGGGSPESEISEFLNLTASSLSLNYILKSEQLLVYNNMSKVCLDEVNKAVFNLSLPCGGNSIFLLGIWPVDKEVKSEC